MSTNEEHSSHRVVVTRLGEASRSVVVAVAVLLSVAIWIFWSREPSSRERLFAWWVGLGVLGPIFVPMVRWVLTWATARRTANVRRGTPVKEILRRAGVAPWRVSTFHVAPHGSGVSIAVSERRKEKTRLVALPGVEFAAISPALEQFLGRRPEPEFALEGRRRGFVIAVYVPWIVIFGGVAVMVSFPDGAMIAALLSAILWHIMTFVALALLVAVFVVPFYDRRRRIVLEREHLVCEPRTLLRRDRSSGRWSVVEDAVWIAWRQVQSIDVVKVRGRRCIVLDADNVFALRVHVPFRWPNVIPDLCQVVAHMKQAQRAAVDRARAPDQTPYRG